VLWFLLTTGACNLSCRYCGGSFSQVYSPWKPVVKAEDVAKFIAVRDPAPIVFFYGGEPLLNPQYIEDVMKAVPHARFGIQTNGTLAKRLPPETWRRFSTVLLSIDGTPRGDGQLQRPRRLRKGGGDVAVAQGGGEMRL
jgi:MoaA/NifB/PqqE/SkfB family radical SAM enzyme